MQKIIDNATECGYRKKLRKNQYPKWIKSSPHTNRGICTKLPKQAHGLPVPCVIVNSPFPIHCPLVNSSELALLCL